MNKFMKINGLLRHGFFLMLCLIGLAIQSFAVPTLPVLWTAGGIDAGSTGPGQAARIATDSSGNVGVVSGPAFGRALAVTSYTPGGVLRWQQSILPASNTFEGVWISAAPNGDFIAVGIVRSNTSSPLFTVTIVRFGSDGTFQWRSDSTGSVFTLGKLVVDSIGNAYLSYNSILQKYSPTGTVLWSTTTGAGDESAALSPDGLDIIVTGAGGGIWRTASFDTATGINKWRVNGTEGNSASDVVVDGSKVYVAGQGFTGVSTPALTYYLTVIAYDRATGARLWRTDKRPAASTIAGGYWMSKAPDGSIAVTGFSMGDWYTVSYTTNGAVRWEASRAAGGLFPSSITVLNDGTTVVTGSGYLSSGFIQGVTVGYSRTGTLLWEGFSSQAVVWLTEIPGGDICTSGGYGALITCFDVPFVITALEPVANIAATPITGTAPLTVSFNGSGSTGPNTLVSWNWNFGDGILGTGVQTTHTYTAPGKYNASLVVADNLGLISVPRNVSIVVTQPPTLPTAPTGLTATSRIRNSVSLRWTNNSTDQTDVKIERCRRETCTNFVEISTVSGTATAFTDIGLSENTYYRYRVRSSNSAGNSPYSNIVKVKTTKR